MVLTLWPAAAIGKHGIRRFEHLREQAIHVKITRLCQRLFYLSPLYFLKFCYSLHNVIISSDCGPLGTRYLREKAVGFRKISLFKFSLGSLPQSKRFQILCSIMITLYSTQYHQYLRGSSRGPTVADHDAVGKRHEVRSGAAPAQAAARLDSDFRRGQRRQGFKNLHGALPATSAVRANSEFFQLCVDSSPGKGKAKRLVV